MNKMWKMLGIAGAMFATACGAPSDFDVVSGEEWIKTGCADVVSAEAKTCPDGRVGDVMLSLDADGYGAFLVDGKVIPAEVRSVIEDGYEVGAEVCEVTRWVPNFVFKSCKRVYVRTDKAFDLCRESPCDRYERI